MKEGPWAFPMAGRRWEALGALGGEERGSPQAPALGMEGDGCWGADPLGKGTLGLGGGGCGNWD